jgi:hypothetical protein
VREVKGAACTLDLPETLGKTSDKVNVRRLKFFEERDADFGDCQGPVQPTLDPLGVRRYEIKRIVAHRVFHRRPEYWVQWEGYDAAWDMWVHRDVLVEDVPDMLVTYHRLGGLPMQPGGLTELETAKTPHLDALASLGVQGASIPVKPGIAPGAGRGIWHCLATTP